jgi:hypothetical protein
VSGDFGGWKDPALCAHNWCQDKAVYEMRRGKVCWQHFKDYYTNYGQDTDPKFIDMMIEDYGRQIPDTPEALDSPPTDKET